MTADAALLAEEASQEDEHTMESDLLEEQEQEEQQSEPAYDPHAAFGALQGIVDRIQSVNGEAQRVFTGIAAEIEYINEQRADLRELTKTLGESAKAILGEYSERISAEAKVLRKGRKGVAVDRLDFLDPTQIWVNKFGDPYWFIVSPWCDRSNTWDKGKIQQNGDAFFGIECPQLRKVVSKDEADQPYALEPLTPSLAAEMMRDNRYLMACNHDGVVHRIPGDWFKDIRVFDRDRFTTPLLSNMQIAQLLAVIDNPSLGAKTHPLQ